MYSIFWRSPILGWSGSCWRESSKRMIRINPQRKLPKHKGYKLLWWKVPDHNCIKREGYSDQGPLSLSWGSSVWKADSCQGKISQNPPQLFYFHWKEKLQEATWELITANLSQIILSSWDAILSLGAPAHFSSLIFN